MKKTPTTPIIPHHVNALVETIIKENPFNAQELTKTLASLQADELQYLEEYIVFCLNQGLSIDYLAQCYGTITADVIRESIYFQEHKKYRYSSFAEVANSVYYNKTYMSLYMHGVLITLFFWPNHLALFRFFRKTLPKNTPGTYLEIGPGHGYFLMTALAQSAYTHFVAIDLSETSINQTKALVDQKNFAKKTKLYCADFLQFPEGTSTYDAIVMGEVLEHVENPQMLLRKIAALAHSTTYIFVTTCINAPMIDHIYLFRDPKEIETLFSDCGLAIKEQCMIPYVGKTLEECTKHFLAINVGYVLEKK
ncbi:MAG: class I SAM-dependent methyltransferase [Legionella sp.]